MSKRVEDLPGCMAERAIWARRKGSVNPTLIQVDDQYLSWVYNEDDGRWYSFDGNYSASSPAEKMQRKLEAEERAEARRYELDAEYEKRTREIEYWSKIRAKVLKRDKSTCQLCHKKGLSKLHIHHILKRLDGGTDHYDNLLTVCPPCHAQADRKLYNPDWI